MRNNLIIGVIVVIATFIGTLTANMLDLGTDNVQAALVIDQNEKTEQLSVMFEAIGLPEFTSRHNFDANEMELFTTALAMAKPCTEEPNNCSNFMEWTGSSDYYTVPYVTTINAGRHHTYYVIPLTQQFVEDVGDYLNARFVVYHVSGAGTLTRVAEDGSVQQNYCAGFECDWFTVDDPNAAKRVRTNALNALTGA